MPPRKTAKRKAATAKRTPSRATRATTKKAPPKLTPEYMQAFLQNMELWWDPLGKDVADLEKLLRRLPTKRALPADIRRRFRALVKSLRRDLRCVFPFRPDAICMPIVKPF